MRLCSLSKAHTCELLNFKSYFSLLFLALPTTSDYSHILQNLQNMSSRCSSLIVLPITLYIFHSAYFWHDFSKSCSSFSCLNIWVTLTCIQSKMQGLLEKHLSFAEKTDVYSIARWFQTQDNWIVRSYLPS